MHAELPLCGHTRVFKFGALGAPGDALLYKKSRPHGFVLEVRPLGEVHVRRYYFDAGSAAAQQAWCAKLAFILESDHDDELSDGLDETARAREGSLTTNFVDDDLSEEDSEPHVEREMTTHDPRRRRAYSAEVYGAHFALRTFAMAPRFAKTQKQRKALLAALSECPLFKDLEAGTMEDVVDAMPVQEFENGACIMKQGCDGDAAYAILDGECGVYYDPGTSEEQGAYVRVLPAGRFFGEMALTYACKRSRSVYAHGHVVLGELNREVYHSLIIRRSQDERHKRVESLRGVAMLETLTDEQIAKIVDVLVSEEYRASDTIIRQGEPGKELYFLVAGECVAEVSTGMSEDADVQEVKRYSPGDVFGEIAILHSVTRRATVKAVSDCRVLVLHRRKFERLFGSLNMLHQLHYVNDPRRVLAAFYEPGDLRGPFGACPTPPSKKPEEATEWFAVYRPTSRVAIAKMLNGVAVGKGLNVKGKSAKKNRNSGFVPFLQISKNCHKQEVEQAVPKARVKIFYTARCARETALAHLEPMLAEKAGLVIETPRVIKLIDEYPELFGIDLPEPVLHEAYIDSQDISFMVGWDTGRQSEPAFMDMNLHALLDKKTEPPCVLFQSDNDWPMNPHGLLMAYEEATVKPVVSDFDTFTVGSKGMVYHEILPPEQIELAQWSLTQTKNIMLNGGDASWNTRWLEVLKQANKEGYHPKPPKYGFADPTSYRLFAQVVKATQDSGAIRHGAECFNYYFPQDLDEEYCVVWNGFAEVDGKPWQYLSEEQLRPFLLARIREGFAFPVNPVWPVRDPGWFEIFRELIQRHEPTCAAWYPESSGIVEQIKEMHARFPEGFVVEPDKPLRFQRTSKFNDLSICERADLIAYTSSPKWDRVRQRMRTAKSFRSGTSSGALFLSKVSKISEATKHSGVSGATAN